MKVIIPDVLQSYTDRQRIVEAGGRDLNALFDQMDGRFPGMRFRVINELDQLRPHIKVFVNRELVRDLDTRLGPDDEIQIVQALSGG
ncbi:MAG: MoaD/ThiS family protein [Pseudomonadales bacterium]|jgi:molybdopterin converting factor small subunit|nr:MoaD/ThiS family protein [Pseudomonadales bacterium]MDP7357542.1 MoaD/ThiS family protein [Pseudomonadales bacterium]MDP7597859.1 MoaD/ThiS family protein [Pseudomonadales bacterium]HJN51095.1 MoaD/ThiS family protein [Pseudomonadales bacterium]|tara:strand:+ start:874 stop:1134 length:261 start_codon:yes stop_codon:yes gene_type:complete